MKLLEHEAKTILRNFSIPLPDSLVITKQYTPELSLPVVLKSQVPVGGRGKAGGIIKISASDDVTPAIDTIFDLPIKGYLPNTILAEQAIDIDKEFYLALIIDRDTSSIQLMANKNGGVEVEENTQDSYLKIVINDSGFDIVGERLAEYFDLPGQTFLLQDVVKNLYSCFTQTDATLLEINPLILTTDNTLLAGDCKMILDDAARFRHPDWQFEDQPSNTSFVELHQEGTVATVANGAGLAMATVDGVVAAGMTPANFLDIGGGANTESVVAAFHRIMEFSEVQVIVINIFAGITRCDEVAKAIIAARNLIDGLPPLFIRLAGTNFEEAVQLLAAENIPTLATLEECLAAAKEIAHE